MALTPEEQAELAELDAAYEKAVPKFTPKAMTENKGSSSLAKRQDAEPMGFRESAVTSGLMSLAQMPFNVASTVTGGKVGQKTAESIEKELRKMRERAPVASAVGEIGSYVVPGMGAAKGIGALTKAIGKSPKSVMGRMVESGAIGAASAPAGFAEDGERGEQIGFGAALGAAVPAVSKTLGATGKILMGSPTVTKESAARRAEQLGFKITPGQTRQDIPISTPGTIFSRSENQSLANRLAAQTTGKSAQIVDAKFINRRFEDLGRQFDEVYKGKTLIVDDEALNALQQISRLQDALPQNAKVSPVKATADKLLQEYGRMVATAQTTGGRAVGNFGIQGELLQKIRSDLLQVSRSIGRNSPVDRKQILDLVDLLDDSVARNNPAEAKILNKIRPQYRSTVILSELDRVGGIDGGNISLERLGSLMQTPRYKTRKSPTAGIDELAYLGQELGIAGRSQGARVRTGEDMALLPRSLRDLAAGTMGAAGLQSQLVRGMQRKAAPTLVRGGTPEPLSPEQQRALAGILGTM